jgi:hypothetical protein
MSGSDYPVTCPNCKATNQARGKAMTLAMVCASCKTYFRIGEWNTERTSFDHQFSPAIPIGTKGRIDKMPYEVMGFVVKRERKHRYLWREYLLFNPLLGYAFLSEYGGHWNMVWPIEDNPRSAADNADFYHTHDGQSHYFRLFQKYKADVVYAQGEFFFDVVDLTDSTTNSEFIAPPYMLALEISDDSYLWCAGEYMTQAEVATAFNIPLAQLPPKKGIGYTQPIISGFTQNSLIKYTAILIVLLIAIQIFFSNNSEEKVVFTQTFDQSGLQEGQKFFVTPSFELEGSSKSVEIQMYAPLNNDWFFGEFSLINEETGIETNFTKDVEYYHGVEDGESWSEGSVVGEAFISEVPGGKYHLNIYPEFSGVTHEFTVTVRRDVPTLSNFFITLVALCLFPAFYFLRKQILEQRRWSESDYSPYSNE